ncbi:hypothetical protein TNCV_3410081 [Trichonephila clavipes]|nr:hypothetical protein TNCV_3410081 [Trichonephila clavipes]
MATLFQPNPRSEALRKDANWEAFEYQNLDQIKIISASSSSINPAPLAHANNQAEGHPRGRPHSMIAELVTHSLNFPTMPM